MKPSFFAFPAALSFSSRLRSFAPVVAVVGFTLLSACALAQQSAKPADACEKLSGLTLPNTTITMAQVVGGGGFQMPAPTGPPPGAHPGAPGAQGGGMLGPGGGGQGGPRGQGGFGGGPGGGGPAAAPNPPFCRVAATLTPSSDSDIKMEVWLPTSGWNGKYEGAGNGGWGGSIQYRGMLEGLQAGYATASTDTGHTGNSGAFLIGHPEKFIDYGYRADHEMTEKAKAIIAAYYGSAPQHSYWVGCSLGGEEALQEARRYPKDYDGIVAGAPVNPLSRLNAAQLWPAWVNMKYPDEAIPASKFYMIHDAALKACASPVGQKQGFVDDPDHCRFDPAVLQCKATGDASDCLTAPQVDLLRKLYAGPVNPRTGDSIFPGMPVGGEIQWALDQGGAKPIIVAVDLYKYAVFQDPSWDWKTMDYDTAITKAIKEVDPVLYADPNLDGFLDRGGKLMMYIGASEYHSFLDLEEYYNTVLKNAAPSRKDQVRLFVVDGMGHCAGGAGADTFAKLSTIDDWVSSSKAPNEIPSSKVTGGKTVFTRPLCAYPLVARYKGTGDINDAASFTCAK